MDSKIKMVNIYEQDTVKVQYYNPSRNYEMSENIASNILMFNVLVKCQKLLLVTSNILVFNILANY